MDLTALTKNRTLNAEKCERVIISLCTASKMKCILASRALVVHNTSWICYRALKERCSLMVMRLTKNMWLKCKVCHIAKQGISTHGAALGLLSRINGFYPLNPGAATLLAKCSKVILDSSVGDQLLYSLKLLYKLIHKDTTINV